MIGPVNKWHVVAGVAGAVLVHLVWMSPWGWAVGALAGWAWSHATDPAQCTLHGALAAEAKKSVGVAVGSPDQVDLVAHADPSVNWCALAVMGWIRRAAARCGKNVPLHGDPGALNTMQQFKDGPEGAHWIPAATILDHPQLVQVGMVPVWTRPTDPPGGGHIGVVVAVHPGGYTAVEGNAGGTHITTHEHAIDALKEPNFLGMGQFTV